VIKTLNEDKINISVILLEPKTPGNIGAIARLCKNFRVNELVLIAPLGDYLSDLAKARAMHSIEILQQAKILNSLQEVRDDVDILIGTSAKAGEAYKAYRQPVFPWQLSELQSARNSKIGIVFGRENCGLSNEEILFCDFLVNIPVPGEHKVLNLSHSVAIVLYEIWKLITQIDVKSTAQRTATYKERKVLFDEFDEIVKILPYKEYKKPNIMHSFRTIINRSIASDVEIHVLIGTFRKMYQLVLKQIEDDINETERY